MNGRLLRGGGCVGVSIFTLPIRAGPAKK
jgi:hypothetical protein